MKRKQSSVQIVGINAVVVVMLLTSALTRTFCQALAEVNRRSCSTLSPFYRAFTTAPPTRCGATDQDEVTVPELEVMVASKNVQLFDVRELDEFQAGSIPGAVNLPLGDVEVSLKLPAETFEQKFGVKAPAIEDDNIVFSCRSGKRSGQALAIARNLGFSKAKHLHGGYTAWKNAMSSN